MTADTGTANLTIASAFVDELVHAGVRHACVCPGSRSTPLAISLARHHGIRVWVHIDERSAGFFALGMARASRQPVALLCSSGTAAANFLPAVVEAHYSRVPLIVLTADRPPELRDFGAAQTIDQIRIYGGHVKWFADMPVPDVTDDLIRHARTSAERAVATALAAPVGPVHLNFPFREPLLPAGGVESVPVAASPVFNSRIPARRVPDSALAEQLVAELSAAERGIVVCGPQDDPEFAAAVVNLGNALGFPILADPLSQVRCGPHDRALVIDSYDLFLRDEAICRDLEPDLVIRFGAIPTSKPLLLYLQRFAGCRQVLVDEGWRDPIFASTDVVQVDAIATCDELLSILDTVGSESSPEWQATWREIDRASRATVAGQLAAIDEPFEGKVFAELAQLLPDGATLFAGNSMPVRDLDAFTGATNTELRFMSNRGANGIDGVVSTAIGAAAVGSGPLVLVIGDLSFYHDMNGLLAARRFDVPVIVVVLNNKGGGIFSFLPQAGQVDRETFEQLFGTPIDLDIEAVAALYGSQYSHPQTWDTFREAVAAGLDGGGLHVIEVRTDRDTNLVQHRAISAAVLERLHERAPSGAV